jgi:hypothetical protein
MLLNQTLTEDGTRIRTQIEKDSYRLSFGRFKGWTIEQVMKVSPGYFASFVQQTAPRDLFYQQQPILKDQLIKAGIWDVILSQTRAKVNKQVISIRSSVSLQPADADVAWEFLEIDANEDETDSGSEEEIP